MPAPTILTRAAKAAMLNIADNDTNLTNLANSIGQGVPETTKGDIGVNNGATNVRLPIGTNDQELIADSAEAVGMRWGTGSGTQLRTDLATDSLTTGAALVANVAQEVDDMAELRTLTIINDKSVWRKYHTTAGDGGHLLFHGVTGATPGTYVDNNGTIAIPAGGDGSSAWVAVKGPGVNVDSFGAANASLTTSAFLAAITAAAGANLIIPSREYTLTAGLSSGPTMSVSADSGSKLVFSGASITGWTLTEGNYSDNDLVMPGIYNATTGLLLYGANLATIRISSIAGCTDALVLRIDDTKVSCADNTVYFTSIYTCTAAGIKLDFQGTNITSKLFQGNAFYGNFVNGCKYSIHFYDLSAGALTIPWDDTYFEIMALEGANVANSIGIYGEPNLPPARCVFNFPAFFDGFTAEYIKAAANNCIFKLGLSGAPAYSKFALTGVGHRIINMAAGQEGTFGVSTPIALTTADNTRATFNSGAAVPMNRFLASITLSATLTAGSTLPFYFYHPLMTNYGPKVFCEPVWNVNLLVRYCVENSTAGVGGPAGEVPYANQGVLRVCAVTDVVAGTYPLWITVHDAPQ